MAVAGLLRGLCVQYNSRSAESAHNIVGDPVEYERRAKSISALLEDLGRGVRRWHAGMRLAIMSSARYYMYDSRALISGGEASADERDAMTRLFVVLRFAGPQVQ